MRIALPRREKTQGPSHRRAVMGGNGGVAAVYADGLMWLAVSAVRWGV